MWVMPLWSPRTRPLSQPAFGAFTEGVADSESTSELLALAEEHAEVAGFLRRVFADLLGGADLNAHTDHEESWCEPARELLRRIPGPHHATCAPPLPAQPARLTRRHKLTCPSESPQHPTPPFPIILIPRPLCSLVTHTEAY